MEYESSTLEIASRHRAASKILFQQWSHRQNNHDDINNNDIRCSLSRNSYTALSTTYQSSPEIGKCHVGQPIRPASVYSALRREADTSRSNNDLPALPFEFQLSDPDHIPIMLHRTPSGAQRKIRQKREENRSNQRLSCYSSISSGCSFSADSYQHQQSVSTTNLPATVESVGSTAHSYFNISPRNATGGFRGGNVADEIASSSADYRSMVDLHGYRSILPDDGEDGSHLFATSERGHSWRTQERDREEMETACTPLPQRISPPSLRFFDASKTLNFSPSQMASNADEEYGSAAEAWQNVISTAGSLSLLSASMSADDLARSRSVRTPQSPDADADGMGEFSSKIGALHNLVGNLVGANSNYHSGSYPNNSNNGASHFGKPTVQVYPMPATRTKTPSASPPETLKKPAPPPVPKKPNHMRPTTVTRLDESANASINKYKINVIPRSPSMDSPAITLWSSKTAAFRDNYSPSDSLNKTPSWKRLSNTVSQYRTTAEGERTLPRASGDEFSVTVLPSSSTVTTPYTMDALASFSNNNNNNKDLNNNCKENNSHRNSDNTDLNSETTQHLGYSSYSTGSYFPNPAHSYSSSLDGATSANAAAEGGVAKKSDSGFSSFQMDLSCASVEMSHSKFGSSDDAGWTYAQRLKANSNSVINLHESLNNALFNPEDHTYDELVALEKRRRECVASLTRKIADRATDLATIDEDLRTVAQSRDALIHEFAACGAGSATAERLLSRLRLHKCEGDELTKLDALLATRREKLAQSKANSEYINKSRERLQQLMEDTRMIRAAYDARESTLEDELFAMFGTPAGGGGGADKLLTEWRFCNQAVVRLNAERRLVDDALAVVRQQLAALDAITVLPRVDAIAPSDNTPE